MKKIVSLFLLTLFVSMFCGCGLSGDAGKTETRKDNAGEKTTESITENITDVATENASEDSTENAAEDIFKNYDYFYKNMYYSGEFDKHFTPEEYMDLSLMLKEKSLYPQVIINKNFFIVRTEQVYENGSFICDYLLVNTQGDIIRNYGNSDWVTHPIKIGDFCFIKLQGVPSKYELIDKNANSLSTLDFNGDRATPLTYLCDLGDEYYLFYVASNGWFNVYILHPTGEYYSIPIIRRVFFGYLDFSQSFENGEAKVEKINEELFSFTYYNSVVKTNRTVYFNSLGENVEYNPNN